LGVPMERRTTAPTPSDCSRARRVVRIKRGIMLEVMFAVVVSNSESEKRIGAEKDDEVVAVISVARLFDVEEVFSLV
jgi:hypothetical protein